MFNWLWTQGGLYIPFFNYNAILRTMHGCLCANSPQQSLSQPLLSVFGVVLELGNQTRTEFLELNSNHPKIKRFSITSTLLFNNPHGHLIPLWRLNNIGRFTACTFNFLSISNIHVEWQQCFTWYGVTKQSCIHRVIKWICSKWVVTMW